MTWDLNQPGCRPFVQALFFPVGIHLCNTCFLLWSSLEWLSCGWYCLSHCSSRVHLYTRYKHGFRKPLRDLQQGLELEESISFSDILKLVSFKLIHRYLPVFGSDQIALSCQNPNHFCINWNKSTPYLRTLVISREIFVCLAISPCNLGARYEKWHYQGIL